MKRILLSLSALLLTVMLCSCGSPFAKPEPTPIPDIDPTTLVTADDVAAYAGYLPVAEPSGTGRNGNIAEVLYRSEPLGQHDTVTVKLTQFTDTIDYQMLFEQYEQEKAKRTIEEIISGIGQEAYIAFPSIHVYDKGCLIDITAGSGADENQKALLMSLATVAAGRLEQIIQ